MTIEFVLTIICRIIALYLVYTVLYPVVGNDILYLILAIILWKIEITTK